MPLSVRLLALVVAAIAVLPAVAPAQDRWRLLDFGLNSGFNNDFEWGTTGAALYFVDSLRGFYYPENEADASQRSYYATTDGGRTWTSLTQPAPIPQTYPGGNFAYSSSGFVSTNVGVSWIRLRPVTEPGFTYMATSLAVANGQSMVTLSQPHETDPGTGELVASGPNRLSFTRNGGGRWTTVDSMVVETIAGTGEKKLELYDSTGVGFLPAPATMTDTFAVGWWQLYAMPDTATALVGTFAYGSVGGRFETHYYLGVLNLTAMTATWRKLPFVAVGSSVTIRPPGIQYISPTVAFALETTTDVTGQTIAMWRTTNAGLAWERIVIPEWVDYASLRFVSENHGVTVNAVTNDGGRSWREWAHPFEGGLFYPSDSTHYFVANRFSLFARSSDAGHTWARNESGAVPRSIAAYGGRVIVGRNYRSLLYSTDRGETWSDAGTEGGLPDDITTIWGVAFPDSITEGNRLIGVASRLTYDADTSLVIIESQNGGQTWTVQRELPGISAPGGPVLLEFLEVAESVIHGYIATGRRLYASTDGGRTWVARDSTLYYQALEMMSGTGGVQVNAGGIYATTTAGASWAKTQSLVSARNRALGLQALSQTHVRSLFPDRTQGNLNWTLAVSDNAGATWTTQDRTAAARPLDGFVFWTSQDSAWAIGRGATVQATGDGGQTFVMHRDTSADFRLLGGWVVSAPDERLLYVAGAGNAIATWEVVPPPASVGHRELAASVLRLIGNPVTGSELVVELGLAAPASLRVAIIDQLGRVVSEIAYDAPAAVQRLRADVADLPSGRYAVRLSRAGESSVLPFVILR